MVQIVLIRPGSTDYDEQGRIQGTLDIPLSAQGNAEVGRAIDELRFLGLTSIYSSHCQSAVQTASAIASALGIKHKKLDNLQNLDLGLWQGMLIEEVKHKQPRVYRQWQAEPEKICPPEGEMLSHAQGRVLPALVKLLKKNKRGSVGLVVQEPLASLVHAFLNQSEVGDLWKGPEICGTWEKFTVDSNPLIHRGLEISNGKSGENAAILPNVVS